MKVTIYPKHVFKQMLDHVHENGGDLANFDYFFISILDPDSPERLHSDTDNFHTWWFYDLDYPIATYNPMSEEQGQELINFILANKDKERCYVHCSAGVSRSGAVGEFINDILGESHEVFKSRNKSIIPNTHIKKILNNLYANI